MDLDNHPAFEQQDAAKRPQILVELLKGLHEEDCFNMLEIGSIRVDSPEYHDGDGHSTLYFARFARENGWHFTTVDLKIDVCTEVLEREGLLEFAEVVKYDGLWYLKHQPDQCRDFVYLDGPDDAEYTMAMFREAMRVVKPHGLVALDDCEDIDSISHKPDAEKGRILVPTLRSMGVPIRRVGKKILVISAEEYHAR
jgi:predicted O-methyltransferase YrrM